MKTKFQTMRIEDRDAAQLQQIADLLGVSRSEAVRELIRGVRVVAVIQVEQPIQAQPVANELVLA